MTTTNRILFNVLARDIEETADFYEALCGLKRIYTSDWYIVMTPTGIVDALKYELGIIDHVHENVPKAARGHFSGGYLTIVVDDIHAAHAKAQELGAEIVSPPTPLDYGQTQMVIRDPNGIVVDISMPTA